MELPMWVAGALRPSLTLTWTDDDGVALNLGGATLSGRIVSIQTGQGRDIAGSFTVTDAAAGEFRWDFDAADVVAGIHLVQFRAEYGAAPPPALTFTAQWTVEAAL